jgi:hypothetical protein
MQSKHSRLTDMQAYPFDVYDIDGTLTIPGHDLWYLCTRTLSADKDLFETYVAEWKSEIQRGMDPFERSLTMMKRGLELLEDGVSSELVTREVQRITGNLIDEGLVSREAINFLKGRTQSGVRAALSTTNYHEGAVGFLRALLLKGWIQETELEKIIVSGSRIDWSSRTVAHFNMGSNKVIGLMDDLGISKEEVKARIGFAFGDDPLGSDRNILELAPYPYVIKNDKHRDLDLPDRVKLVTWLEVAAMSVAELARMHTATAHK